MGHYLLALFVASLSFQASYATIKWNLTNYVTAPDNLTVSNIDYYDPPSGCAGKMDVHSVLAVLCMSLHLCHSYSETIDDHISLLPDAKTCA
jgi:hypothetical protein